MMTPSEEFRRHAAECQRMARSTPDRQNKETWKSLAQRWMTCADLADRATELAHASNGTKHTRPSKRFAH